MKIKNLFALGLLFAVAFMGHLFADSKNTTGTTSEQIVFGVATEPHLLTAVDATSDKVGSKVTVKNRTAHPTSYIVTGAGATSQAVIPIAAGTTGIASNDLVVVTGDGYAAYSGTVVGVTASNITLSANLTSACAAGNQVYEMATVYTFAVGSNSVNRTGSPLVKTPKDSPILIQLDSTAAGELSATVQ